MNTKLIFTGLALIVGNFLYQAAFEQHWSEALERSFSQIVALFAVWLNPLK